MGILNMTPDSFYDGGEYFDDSNLRDRYKSLNQADIIDIGAESSRPGSVSISKKDELNRLSKIFDLLIKSETYYSIDTYKPDVAEFAIQNGFNMINDITGGGNGKMFEIASEFNVPIVIMHMQGTPNCMQKAPKYSNIIDELLMYFDERIKFAVDCGVNEKQIIIDPGIGFGKTVQHNDKIIKDLRKFKRFNLPLLVGLSRKSFLAYNSNEPKDRLGASLSIGAIAINNGANIIRVHDIEESILNFSIVDRLLSEK